MPVQIDWQQISEILLQKIDVEGEFRSMGVDFTGTRPSPSGWLSCWARDRPHGNSPSAACNIGDGPARGRYRDMGGECLSLSFWDFVAQFGTYGGTWQDARLHFARKHNVP